MRFFRSRVFPLLVPLLFTAISTGTGQVFNILDYGAKGDGTSRATGAINTAIQAAKSAGGGTVYIPAGSYVTGPVELVSNLVLHIEAGAVLHFPAERLPFTKGRHQGIECITPVPLIGGHDLENVTITGGGIITTSNADWMKIMGRSPGSAAGPNWAHLLESLEKKTPASDDEYRRTAPELRPSFIRLMNSTNILIEGIRIIGSAQWPIHLLYSGNAVVRNVTVETYPGVHTGGIYIDSSHDIRISDCSIDTGDDGIVLKSGKDSDGLRVNIPTENIVITNCTVHRAHGAVVLGSETAGGIRNVVATNITCDGTKMGIRIKSRRGRGGAIEDVLFNNWTMKDVGQAINITNYYLMEGERRTAEEPVTKRTPVFKNIAISDVVISRARVAINIDGLPEMPIDGLRLSDVVATAAVGMKASNTRALELHHVQVNADSGASFTIRNAKDLELDGVSTRIPHAGAPVVRLDQCPGAIVRNCRAFPGTDIFLSVPRGASGEVIAQDNVLASAHRALEELDADYWQVVEPATEDK